MDEMGSCVFYVVSFVPSSVCVFLPQHLTSHRQSSPPLPSLRCTFNMEIPSLPILRYEERVPRPFTTFSLVAEGSAATSLSAATTWAPEAGGGPYCRGVGCVNLSGGQLGATSPPPTIARESKGSLPRSLPGGAAAILLS